MTKERIIEKLLKIKAHAESAAKIGSEAEAEAFASMFQQLLIQHRLNMTDIEVAEEADDDPVNRREVDWKDVKVRSNRIAWIERLADIISRAYFCRIVVHSGSSNLTLVGHDSDATVAEFMIVTLVRAAEKLAKKEFGVLYRRSPESAKDFKASFLKAFIERLAERFNEEIKKARTSSETAIVVFNRAEADVKDFMNQNMSLKRASIVRGARHDVNAIGWRRGREIADGINLKPNVVGAGGKTDAPKQLH